MSKLDKDFFVREDVVQISRELIGKVLITEINGNRTAGIITETEAYAGAIDKASHAYNNRRTPRTEVMYSFGGVAYIYLCYGIHHLFNIVTNDKDIPHAILIRGIKPIEGIQIMLKRRNQKKLIDKLASGPGTLSKALGINTRLTGTDLSGNIIWVEDRGIIINSKDIIVGPRIGIDYAGEDAFLPYRFLLRKSI
jgi:DNA-3-methyladenine glycosylase